MDHIKPEVLILCLVAGFLGPQAYYDSLVASIGSSLAELFHIVP